MGKIARRVGCHWATASILLIGFIVVYWYYPPSLPDSNTPGAGLPLPANFVDTRWQLFLCRLYAATSVLAGLILSYRRSTPLSVNVYAAGAVVWLSLALAEYVLVVPAMPASPLLGLLADRYGVICVPSLSLYLASAASTLLLLVVLPSPGSKARSASSPVCMGLVIGYVALLVLPGLLASINLERAAAGSVAGTAWHFEAVFGRPNVGSQMPESPLYGPLYSALLRRLEDWRGQLSFLHEIKLLQLGNALYAGLALLVVWCRFPTRPALCLIPLGLALPWVHTLHGDLFAPNQAGWRYIGFPLTMLAILAAGRLTLARTAFLYGCLFGGLLSWNPETGIACGVGLAAFLTLRSTIPQDLLKISGGFLSGTAAAVAICFVVTLVGPGQDLISAFRDRAQLLMTTTVLNHNNLRLVYDPIAVLVALYASATVMSGLRAWRGQGAALGAARRGALGAMLLAWLPYYAFRPDPWNLWSYLFILGFLIAEQMLGYFRGHVRARVAMLAKPLSAALVLVVGPAILIQNMQAGASLLALVRPPPAMPGVPVLGVMLRADDGSQVQLLAAGLSQLEPSGTVISSVGYLLAKMAPGWAPHMVLDPTLLAIFNPARVEATINRLRAARETVLLEDVRETPDQNDRRKVFLHMVDRLRDRFEAEPGPPGWIRLKPR